jgi:uncharacterized protein YyaL (SSP411 family)
VAWQPWGDAAFDEAARRNVPVFVSIGYAACHWCHVMERESFEHEGIAALLNRHFVPVKVDREERPDIDEIYMNAVQLLTGAGGWPLSAFLTPERKPFFGGTYFPPTEMYGRVGFETLLRNIVRVWSDQRSRLRQDADKLTGILRRLARPSHAPHRTGEITRDDIFAALRETYDREYGGFGDGAKFPPVPALRYLLRYHAHTGSADAREMALRTLDAMAEGGLYDYLGGGFHRYTVDRGWRTPHFEMMLYDNALLAGVYLDAWALTGASRYRQVAEETLGRLARDMRDPRGLFYASRDADTPEGEGAYYLWRAGEIEEILGASDAGVLMRACGVRAEGNVSSSEPAHAGANILYRPAPAAVSDESDAARIDSMRRRLLAARRMRTAPAVDDTAVTCWNAFAIAALVRAWGLLHARRYLQLAQDCATALCDVMIDDTGVRRTWRRGRPGAHGALEDYAALGGALLDCYEADFSTGRAREALRIGETMIGRFWDAEAGAFRGAGSDAGLIANPLTFHDSATPSGNALAISLLQRLYSLTGRDDLREKADRAIAVGTAESARAPTAALSLALARERRARGMVDIVIAGRIDDPGVRALARVVHERYLPDHTIAHIDPADPDAARAGDAFASLRGRTTCDGAAAAYVCRDFACAAPVTDPEKLARMLEDSLDD